MRSLSSFLPQWKGAFVSRLNGRAPCRCLEQRLSETLDDIDRERQYRFEAGEAVLLRKDDRALRELVLQFMLR